MPKVLEPDWQKESNTLKNAFTIGYSDIINIVNRIDREMHSLHIIERVKNLVEPALSLEVIESTMRQLAITSHKTLIEKEHEYSAYSLVL